MKTINKYFLMLAMVAFGLTACEEEVKREPSPDFDGKKAVFFPISEEAKEVDPKDVFEHEIMIVRTSKAAEATIKLKVQENTSKVFTVPESVKFAAKQDTTTFKVKFPKAKIDSTYTLVITLDDAVSDPYRVEHPTYQLTINVAKWNDVTDKVAVVFDGITNVFYGVGNPGWYCPYQRKDNADGSFDIRLLNVYTRLPEYKDGDYDSPIADKFGIYGGYPYNYPEDVDSEGTYNMTLHVAKNGAATFDAFALGMTWSYGAFYGAHAPSAGQGVFNKADQSITFPGGSVLCAMSGYKDGAWYSGTEPMIVFLDDALWQDINSAISVESLEDGFNDASLEWKPIAGELRTLVSSIESDSWDVQLENVIDPNPKDKQGEGSDFFNLFRLADVYAEGFGLAFYWDTIKGKIELPAMIQPTGMNYLSKDIYVGPSATTESFVEDITLKGSKVKAFHFFLQVQTKDGGDMGEYEEVFYLGPKAIVWEKKDYIGAFTLTGFSPFDGSAMAQNVVIKEENDALIMLGVARADTIVLGFDAETGAISIEPQFLPGVFSYQGTDYPIVLATFDEDFNIGFTAKLEFAFDLSGVAKLTANSEAIGYLVQAYQLGNLAGCYDLALVPAPAAAVAPRNLGAASLQTVAPKLGQRAAKQNELKIKGQLPRHNFFMRY